MFYAHEGSSNDNAFTTYNGVPTRSFVAFKTKKARHEYQEKVWNESGHQRNVIFCYRKDVVAFYPKFFVSENTVFPCYEDYYEQQSYTKRKSLT